MKQAHSSKSPFLAVSYLPFWRMPGRQRYQKHVPCRPAPCKCNRTVAFTHPQPKRLQPRPLSALSVQYKLSALSTNFCTIDVQQEALHYRLQVATRSRLAMCSRASDGGQSRETVDACVRAHRRVHT
eukprot:928077-Pleurochrysis_carterae.AAC.1